jgi:hypothetical protein
MFLPTGLSTKGREEALYSWAWHTGSPRKPKVSHPLGNLGL